MDRWQSYHFRMKWEDNQAPKVWIDLYILDNIIRDILTGQRDQISLWRVHRRWERNTPAGHQFKFMCFTNKKTAESIDQSIKKSITLTVLKGANLLRELEYFWDDSSSKSHFEDESSISWRPALRRSWPYFIQGVSEILLNLVSEIKKNIGTKIPPNKLKHIEALEAYYQDVEDRIIRIWHDQGNHAFFHHINALFGYQPLQINPTLFGLIARF